MRLRRKGPEGIDLPRFLNKFNDTKLRNKMVLSYVLFFILPFLIIGFFVVQEYRQSALNKATEQTESTVERVKTRTNDTLEVAISLSNRLTLDTDLENVVTTRYQDTSEVVDAYRNYKKFQTYLDFNPEISRINLYADNPTLLNNWEFFPLDRETKSSNWYKEALKYAGQIGWFYFPSVNRKSESMLSLVRSVYFQGSRTIGMMSIDVNTALLDSVLRLEDSETVLTDGNGIVVASNRPNMIGKPLAETHLGKDIAALPPGTYQKTIDEQQSKVLIAHLVPEKSFNSLKIISVFSIQNIMREANRISTMGINIIGIVTIIALVITYLICTVLTNRLLNFSRQMSRVSMGNFNAGITVDGNDEIGQISRQFNQMVLNIKDLMEEVTRSHQETSELERKQNEIKMKMLASQINPHFLYNALESIRMKAHLNGEKEISQAVKVLGKLMRKNLEITGQDISLNEEIEIIRCYLEIQKFRHDDRLDYEIDVEPAAGKIPIMPLLIQPLVENSVVHGLENHFGGGKVKVQARLEGRGLRVSVEDNGAGISGKKLSAVLHSLQNQETDRIGLSNIQQRLLITYGKASELQIESGKGKGTRVSFWIPTEESSHV